VAPSGPRQPPPILLEKPEVRLSAANANAVDSGSHA